MAIDKYMAHVILHNYIGLISMGVPEAEAKQEVLNHEQPLDFGRRLVLKRESSQTGNTPGSNTSNIGGGGTYGYGS